MSKLVVRWQMGPYEEGPSWDALDLSMRLMRGNFPDAAFHVTYQGASHFRPAPVTYTAHQQTLPKWEPYCSGRHIPSRYDFEAHELWLDNDHIMWGVPPGMHRWLLRSDAVLVWRTDWAYYGRYAGFDTSGWNASAGMWGLPPWCVMPFPVYLGETERNQDEYGFVVKWLYEQPRHEYVYEAADVRCYCPDHSTLMGRDTIGIYGVHLNGLNRGWNAKGEALLYKLREKFLEGKEVELPWPSCYYARGR